MILVLLAGCATPADVASPTPASTNTAAATSTSSASAAAIADVLDVGLEYPRYLQTRRRVEVTVTNAGETPVTITRLTLTAPQFTPVPPVSKDTTIGPDRRVDLQIGYGAVLCPVPSDSDASATLRVGEPDGTTSDVTYALPVAVLTDIHDDECGQQAVLEAVDLRLSGDTHRTDQGLRTHLVIRRRTAAVPVRATHVRGSVIFTVEPVDSSQAPLVELTPDQDETRLPLEIVASRCDPHAVADSKKTYLFSVWVEVGDAPTQLVTIDAQPVMGARLDRLIDECMTADD